MPLPVLFFLIATLLPGISFLLLAFLGGRMGRPLAGWVGTGFVVGSFAMSIAGLIAWLNGGQLAGIDWGLGDNPIDLSFKWMGFGGGAVQDHPGILDVDLIVDSLTVAMFNMVSLILLMVHFFSIGSMADEEGYPRYFMDLSLLGFAMLGLILGGTLLQMFVFWELIALSTFLLIRFRRGKAGAGRAFLLNRIGDLGFVFAIGLLFGRLGNVSLLDVDGMAGTLISPARLNVIGVAFICGAIAMSAQLPLHTWLVEAMETPAPAAGLICGATTLAAGVYLIARVFPFLTDDAKLFVAIVGTVTLTLGALLSMVQSDIKRVLAYSAMSQVGYMMLAIGIGSWVGALFHLITHAFFLGLLFLAAGSLVRAAGDEQKLAEFGGLMRKLPVTAVTFGIGALALAGAPFLSGFYSKEMILIHAGAWATQAAQDGKSPISWAFFVLPLAMAGVIAFSMVRCWMLCFWGKPRNEGIYAGARESSILFFPLLALAGVSILGGSRLMDIRRIVAEAPGEITNYCIVNREPGIRPFTGFSNVWPTDVGAAEGTPDAALEWAGQQRVDRWATPLVVAGLLLGVISFWKSRPRSI